MDPIKVLIIDDEQGARSLLKSLLSGFCKGVEVVETCADLPNGVKAIRKLKPQLIFLDIEMPGHSGLELLDFFDEDEIDFSIVFTTAYSEYAVRAFKLSAIDYLLKPIELSDLEETIERFKRKSAAEKRDLALQVENMGNLQRKKIGIPTQNGVKFIGIDEIVYMKADNSYTELYNSKDEKFVVSRTLKNFEDILKDNPKFIRVHKSYLVNSDFISDYVKSDGGYLLLSNKHTVAISPEKVELLFKNKLIVKR
jgi:two-component system LytT family response regulator